VPSLAGARPGLRVHPALDGVVARAMAKAREERFDDANAMRAALRAVPRPPAVVTG